MNKSEDLFHRARQIIPGGVNSPVRACRAVGATPLFIKEGKGSKIITVDGEEMVDFVMSWGPLILGHARDEVIEAAYQAMKKGSSFGAPCEYEVEMATLLTNAISSLEMVRMVSSGTEATMSAIRLARGYTGRDKIVKFVGCYHGHVDYLLAQAGSGVATFSIPGTPGVCEDIVKNTLLIPYNHIDAVEEVFKKEGEHIACVIVEPVAGNMGLIPPKENFLTALREITIRYKSLLIFDEVITGFRFCYGGFQDKVGIYPDITCLGKIIGGGFPVGAFGGRREIMERLAPVGDVYQAGTLSGNPVAMAAGISTLKLLQKENYEALTSKTLSFTEELKNIFVQKGINSKINVMGSAFTIFFTSNKEIYDFETASTTDTNIFAQYYRHLRRKGINIPPSNFECLFTSFAHSEEDLCKMIDATRDFAPQSS